MMQEDLAEIFRLIAKNHFSGTLISITNVRISPDLGLARIHLSIFPTARQKEIMDWSRDNKSFVKDQLVRVSKGSLRKMPDLEFYLDDSLDYKDNIDRLLRGEGENPLR